MRNDLAVYSAASGPDVAGDMDGLGPSTGRNDMQFGVFTVGDVTRDPVSGETVSEETRIKSMVAVALKAS